MSRDLTLHNAHARTHTHVHMCVPVVKTRSPRPVSEADPEMEIQVPGAYLGQDPRKHRQGMRNETGQGSQYRMCLSQVITMANRAPPHQGPLGDRVPHQGARGLIHQLPPITGGRMFPACGSVC